jgi:ABC-type Fe3+ transport system permease subunit
MDIRTDIIVYIWLLPLFFFVILPLSMLVVYTFWRLIYFMFFPRRMREQEVEEDISERNIEKVL